MVRTRGGSRVRPRVRFSTPEREAAAPVPDPEVAVPAPVSEPEATAPVPAPEPSPVPGAVPDEPLGFRRYQTRVGPRAPSPVPQRRVRRARPSKRARTSGPGLPSGLALRAQASHHHLDRHHHHQQQQLRRHIHLSYHRPRGSGGPCM